MAITEIVMTVGTVLKRSKVKIIKMASTRTGLKTSVKTAKTTNKAVVMCRFLRKCLKRLGEIYADGKVGIGAVLRSAFKRHRKN
jgi:hypothetical protein